ncbi:hypothetical protein ACFOSC_31155 [Streptantibioticus rubrisoli]|uniref:Uncharacterized protein n=1 Tax=Streptantibioticus rubrisoli TaxID=1387313 RepID=A0ABT1PLC2_9ACTN|nr:hypothetical protein [Streptantibioticus rubrisoli]MCQ4045028.1 hypothetical protein [Streptantibioticus rubrisoli]
MPLFPEEPQIHESVPGPRAAAGGTRTPQAPRPAPVPGPRPGPRPAPPRAPRNHPSPGHPGAARTTAPAGSSATRAAEATAQIQLVPATDATAIEAADNAVDTLLDSGRAPSDILVLTTGETHPWAQHELSFGEESYWRQQDEADDVFYARATAERAVKRPVVVLAVNGGTDEESARALPAAMARAESLLVVCGDPERLRSLL